MRRFIITLLIVCFSSVSCTFTPPQLAEIDWHSVNIVGLTIDLIDPQKIETYSFGEGTVAMTVGRKNGFVTGPLAEWKVIDNRLMIGFWGEGTTAPQKGSGFALVSKSDSMLVLRDSSGAIKKFNVLAHR